MCILFALFCAFCLSDYFSQHSRGMGPGMFMPIPMGGGGGGGGAGAAGTAVGADTVGAMMGGDDDGLGEEGVVDGDDFGSDSPDSGFQDGEYGGDFQAPDNANQEWGTFEEADHGFTDDPSSDGSGEWGFGDASDVGDAGEAGEGASQGIGWVLENLGDFFGGDS